VEEVCRKILLAIANYKFDIGLDNFQIMINPLFFGNSTIGCFDGTAIVEKSGIGIMVKISSTHCYKAFMAIGQGSNIRVELMVFWGLLYLCQKLNLQVLYAT